MKQRRNWKRVRARSLREAMELCIEFALDVHRRKVPEIAELMGVPSHFTLYKWLESARLPAVMIRPFEYACGCTFVTDFLGSSAHKLVIDIPKGKPSGALEITDLQGRLSDAVGSLIRFYQGGADAEQTEAALTGVMTDLAFHRENVKRAAQPELGLFGGDDD